MTALEGIKLELEDSPLPLIRDINITDLEAIAFKDIDIALLIGAWPRTENMTRKALLKQNVNIFKSQGMALDKYAKKTCKVLVVGNPANTNCFIASKFAPSIPKENFSALTRLDHNRAKAQVALKLGVCADNVKNVTIWGNHSSTQFPDLRETKVTLNNGNIVNALQEINDDHWMKYEFITVRFICIFLVN
jgi:malate dehydrogenase